MKIRIEKLQNEKEARKLGVKPPQLGDVLDFPVVGTNEIYIDRYELRYSDGKLVNAGFPIAYGKDEQGNDYLLCYLGEIKAFKTIRKY